MLQPIINGAVLVTGGSGFLGIHIIAQLLGLGHKVKTTSWNLSKKNQLLEALRTNGDYNLDDLSFFQADFPQDEGWNLAATDCTYVLHVASPFPMGEPDNEDELIVPALEPQNTVIRFIANMIKSQPFGAIHPIKVVEKSRPKGGKPHHRSIHWITIPVEFPTT